MRRREACQAGLVHDEKGPACLPFARVSGNVLEKVAGPGFRRGIERIAVSSLGGLALIASAASEDRALLCGFWIHADAMRCPTVVVLFGNRRTADLPRQHMQVLPEPVDLYMISSTVHGTPYRAIHRWLLSFAMIQQIPSLPPIGITQPPARSFADNTFSRATGSRTRPRPMRQSAQRKYAPNRRKRRIRHNGDFAHMRLADKQNLASRVSRTTPEEKSGSTQSMGPASGPG